MEKVTGYVTGVNGNLVSARFSGSVRKNEVGFVKIGNDRLKGEVIRISGDAVSMQIYEMTNGIQVGDEVELTGELLSVELGPGLLTQVYDGLQNPLPKLAEQCGFFLERGVYLDPIPDKEWEFTPCVKPGDAVLAGDAVGSVPEGQFTHLIMAPFDLKDEGWRVKSVKEKGVYHVRSTVAVLENGAGEEKALSMVFSWPVKQPIRCYEERLRPDETLVTKIRCIDTFLPVAKGGTFCVPGPFGAGKTVLQHMEAKNADVDIVIVAACGERAGEVVEVLKEFPELTDPRTGRSLMERTIIICNTSSMPVAAREASVYTAVTMAEYYRQMGLNVLLLADSTSRWAQAMREMSGRLEEIPGEDFDAVVNTIIGARRIYILGLRSSGVLAGFLSFYFNHIFEDVVNVGAAQGETFEQMLRIGPEDVLIAISFPRYSQRTLKAVHYAKKQGACIIGITDSTSAPLAAMSNQVLLARSEMASFVDSLVAPMSLLNAIIVAVGLRKKHETSNTYAMLEQIWSDYDVYEKKEEIHSAP